MMTLGGVPIIVARPPRMAPKLNGISNAAGERCCLRAVSSATGISIANAPTLFMKAEQMPHVRVRAAKCSCGRSVRGANQPAIISTTPALRRPRLIISTATTVTTAGWPKPVKIDPAGTRPAIAVANSAKTATTS